MSNHNNFNEEQGISEVVEAIKTSSENTETLEMKLDANTNIKNIKSDGLGVEYGFAEEQFFQEQVVVDYNRLWYGEEKTPLTFSFEDEYWTQQPIVDTEAETMTMEEAENMVQDIQYASVLGQMSEMDHTERRKFASWTEFNKVFLNLFHSMYAVTSDIDYSRTF